MKSTRYLALAFVLGLVGCSSEHGDDAAAEDLEGNASSEEQELSLAGQKKYLALGDSIPAGYTEALAQQFFASLAPGSKTHAPHLIAFSAYPEVFALTNLTLVTNAGCPGETSGSFLNRNAPDNGCGQWRAAGGPLHVRYANLAQSQMAFALDSLAKPDRTKLISLTIGANDLFLLQAPCFALQSDPAVLAAAQAAGQEAYVAALTAGKTPEEAAAAAEKAGTAHVTGVVTQCIVGGLPGMLGTLGQNLATIIGQLRSKSTQYIAVNNYYYPQQYNVEGDTNFQVVGLMNQTIAQVVDAFRAQGDTKVVLVDQFAAFAAAGRGNPCTAGLIAKDPTTGECELHPSTAGDVILARTLDRAVPVRFF